MFGCCPDGRTPAPGPAHAGCPSEFPRKEEGTLCTHSTKIIIIDLVVSLMAVHVGPTHTNEISGHFIHQELLFPVITATVLR